MKRFLSLFLALIVAVGICFSAPMTIEAEAAKNAQALAKLDSVITNVSGCRVGLDNSNNCFQCTTNICNAMYGCAPSGPSGYTLTRPGNFELVAQTTGTGVNATTLAHVLSQAMPGDFVQMKWTTYQHSAIVYSADATSFTIIQDGNDKHGGDWLSIHKKTYTYSSDYKKWSGDGLGISLYRYNGYHELFPDDGRVCVITYDLNGGTGGPPKIQTKYPGAHIQLSSAVPTKSNYTFVNWKSSSDEKYYNPGSWYTVDSNTTMVAQWTKATKPSNVKLTASATSIPVNGSITFNASATNATSYYIGIDKDGKRIHEQYIDSSFTYKCTSAGSYSAYFTASNSVGYTDSPKVYWTVQSPPAAPTVKLSKTSLTVGESATLSWNSVSGATKYWISCWNSSDHVINEASTALSKTVSFSTPGEYSITVVSIDAYGQETIGNWINFTVSNKSYTISYDANGGSGAPSSQTKTHGTNLTLSTTKPTKTGYTFKGWGTSASDTTVDYAPGATYSTNANITLYAIWERKTYTVKYDANGGTGAPAPQTKMHGTDLVLSRELPTKDGFIFRGWEHVSSSGTTIIYTPGSSYLTNADITLYAIWMKDTWFITYDANGGYNAPGVQGNSVGFSINITNNIPKRTGYDFQCWVYKDGSDTITYYPGQECRFNEDVTLYAQWKCNHTLGTTIVNAKDPTYTEEGYTGDTKCNTCEEIIKTGTSISKLKPSTPIVTVTNKGDGINVSWNNINGAQSYIVYRKTYNDSTKAWSSWESLTSDCTATSYTDTKALLGVYYKYTTVAVVGDVKSEFTASNTVKRDVAPTVKAENKTSGVNVSWNSVYGAQKYIVYRKTYNESAKAWGSWEILTSNCTATNYSDTKTLVCERYKYTVVAVRNGVNSSFVESAMLQRGVAPTVTVANAEAGVTVSWNSVNGAQKYIVYRKSYNDSTKAWSSWELLTGSCTATSYSDEKALIGVKYKYTVVATRNGVNSSFVESAMLQRDVAPTVTVANANDGIKVSWNSIYGAQKYVVYRKTYKDTTKAWSSWESLTGSCTATNYTDTKALLGVKYIYTVVATRNGVNSKFVATNELQRNASPVVAVKNITTGIKISWYQVYGAQKYIVYRKTYNESTKAWSSWEPLTNNCTSTSYVDNTALFNAKCMYTVVAVRGNFRSTFTATDVIQFNIVPDVKAKNEADGINVTWNSINGATSYRVYRKTYDEATKTWGEWDRLENGYKSTSYVDKKAMLSVSYKYTVRAVISEDVKSSYVATPLIKRDVAPTVKAENQADGVKLTWNSIYGAQKYVVYRKTYNDTTKTWGSWEVVNAKCVSISYTDTKAMLGEKYKYTVVAVRGDFRSTFIETTLLQRNAAPTVTIAKQSNGIKVNWSSVYGAQNYTVYRKTYNATTKTWGGWQAIKTGCTGTSYTDTTVKNGTYYRYTVCGVRNNFQSSFVQSTALQYVK